MAIDQSTIDKEIEEFRKSIDKDIEIGTRKPNQDSFDKAIAALEIDPANEAALSQAREDLLGTLRMHWRSSSSQTAKKRPSDLKNNAQALRKQVEDLRSGLGELFENAGHNRIFELLAAGESIVVNPSPELANYLQLHHELFQSPDGESPPKTDEVLFNLERLADLIEKAVEGKQSKGPPNTTSSRNILLVSLALSFKTHYAGRRPRQNRTLYIDHALASIGIKIPDRRTREKCLQSWDKFIKNSRVPKKIVRRRPRI